MAGKVLRVASVVVAVVVVRIVVVVLIVDGQVHTVFARKKKSTKQNCDYYFRKFLFLR